MIYNLDEYEFIRKILFCATTNFIPLNNYRIIEYPQKIPLEPHMRIWRNQFYWDEARKIFEPSKICFICDEDNDISDVYSQIIMNGCSLIDSRYYNKKRYIIIRPRRFFDCPVYDLKSSGTVLLYCGGGYGDQFNLLRYIKLYPQAKFVIECSSSLHKFFTKTNLFYKVILKGEIYKTDFHLYTDTLYRKHGYNGSKMPVVSVDPHEDVRGGFGFCFMGNRIKYTGRRFFNYQILEKFKKFGLYNLQIEEKIDFAINLKINDWYDTARIVQGCDYIICPPTSLLHLAGVMGKPVIAVFKKDYEDFEIQYFDKSGSKFYNLVKVQENNLENYLKNLCCVLA